MLDIANIKHLNSGECADIYQVDEQTVLKLSKPGWDREMLYQEYVNGKAIANCGILAPQVYDFVEVDQRYGYTMEKLNDVTLLDLIWKHPLKVISYAKKMAEIHVKIHQAIPPNELPSLADKYKKFIGEKSSIDDKVKSQILQEIDTLCCGTNCICHGDFHPINVLVDANRYFVIDWVLATKGQPEADVAGTYLITKVYSSNKKEKNIFKRWINSIGGKLIANAYLRKYISLTGVDKKTIAKWIPIRAATYLDVGLSPEIEKIFRKILSKHYN